MAERGEPGCGDGGRGIFVTDYDGTLLTDDRTLRQEDLETLARLRSDSVLVVIATGRSLFSFTRSLKVIGLSAQDLPVDYLVFSTGAGIFDIRASKVIRALDLPKEAILRCCDFFEKHRFDYMIHGPVPDTQYFLYKSHGGLNPDFQARIDFYPGMGTALNGATRIYGRATEVLSIVPRKVFEKSRDDISTALSGTSVIFATSPMDHTSVWIEIFHPGVSKSKSVAWLLGELGLSGEQVVAVGNDYNDQDLLMWSAKGFMVENGPADLRDTFTIVPSNNCGGVSHAARMAGLLR